MPNGFHGPPDSWDRLEAPLRSLDPTLDAFARAHGLPVGRNQRGWPARSIRWGHPVSRLIEVYLEDEVHLSWTLWVCAAEDRGDDRYWRHASLRKAVPIDDLAVDLPALLEEARQIVEGWSSDDLELATHLERSPT